MAAAGFQESRGAGTKVSIVKANVMLLESLFCIFVPTLGNALEKE